VPADLSKLPVIAPASRAEWRSWLEANHDSVDAIRLAIGKKSSRVPALAYDDAVEEALCFGWIDSTAGRLDEDRYTVLATPRKRGSVWSRPNKERVARLIAAGLMTPAGLAPIEAAKADGSWEALDTVEALEEPADLTAALDAEPAARAAFDAFPPGSRKLALYWIAQAKRPETRARRIAETVAAAARGERVR
jgi:uncharacterized protein YdeI (YjbR/CyaY-like superfamily)